ncbi:MAG: hypothetical protein MUE30_08835 [Spirosomaceae bacterium]|jgi:hypothetical protein|nr:hypothetical protein [Spirosomataceae bacterium]
MIVSRVYDEMLDFITSAPSAAEIVSFAPSQQAQQRLEILQFKHREEQLTEAELHELEQYLMIEHIMRMAKAKARKRLNA